MFYSLSFICFPVTIREREDSEAIPDYLKKVEHLRDSHYIGGLTMPGGAKTSWWKKMKDNE